MTPAVSVITPAFDAATTLEATIASVLAQTRTDWEMLIADDGSTDATAAIAAAWAARDPRIRPLPGPGREGPAAARNRAIRAARGRFIAFLDADDRWRPEKLARQLAFMQAEATPFSFTAYRREDASRPRPRHRPRARRGSTTPTLLKGNVIGCLTAVYDTAHFGKVEMPPLPLRQDYALWLTLLRQGGVARGLDEVLADYRVGAGSLSGSKLRAARGTWAVLRREGLPLPRTLWCFGHYALSGLSRATAERSGPQP